MLICLCRGLNHGLRVECKIINFGHVKRRVGGAFLSLFMHPTLSDFSVFKCFTTDNVGPNISSNVFIFNSFLNISCLCRTALFFFVLLPSPLPPNPFGIMTVRLRAPASYRQYFSTELNERQTLLRRLGMKLSLMFLLLKEVRLSDMLD